MSWNPLIIHVSRIKKVLHYQDSNLVLTFLEFIFLVKTLSVQEQIERNNFVLATPPTSQKLPKKLTAPPTPTSSGKKGKNRAKPLPPPRSASTRRISNATNPSSGTSSSTATPTSPTHRHLVTVTNNNHVMKSAPAEPNITAGYQSLSSESSGAFHSISAGIKINILLIIK